MAFLTSLLIGGIVAKTVLDARAQHKASSEQARIAEANAAVSETQAVDASRRGEEEGSTFRRQVRSLIGRQRAGFAGQGVDVNVGTAAALRTSTAALGESDIARIHRNAEREAQGYKAQAEDYRHGAQYARSAGRWAVGSTILGGAMDVGMLAQRQGWGQPQPGQVGTTQVPNRRGGPTYGSGGTGMVMSSVDPVFNIYNESPRVGTFPQSGRPSSRRNLFT